MAVCFVAGWTTGAASSITFADGATTIFSGDALSIAEALATGVASAGIQSGRADVRHAGSNDESTGSKMAPNSATDHVKCRTAAEDLRNASINSAASASSTVLFSAAPASSGKMAGLVKKFMRGWFMVSGHPSGFVR